MEVSLGRLVQDCTVVCSSYGGCERLETRGQVLLEIVVIGRDLKGS